MFIVVCVQSFLYLWTINNEKQNEMKLSYHKYEYLLWLQDLRNDYYNKGLMEKALEVQKQLDELTK